MNVLLSGGSGYIGNYVVEELLSANHRVGVISRAENQFTEAYKNRVDFYQQEITVPFSFKPILPYDIFIHLAAANDVDSVNPTNALLASSLGTRFALDFSRKNQIKKFIYISTFQVMGDVGGYMEENTYPKPLNDYGITHFFAEQYVEMYRRNGFLDSIILRPTNIYGAPMFKSTDRWTLVPLCFCKEAFEKQEINLMSSGRQVRDFINLQDLVKLTLLYCEAFDEYKNNIVNVSSGNKFTILEIATSVKNIYENSFGVSCALKVHSDEPQTENSFYICRDRLSKSGFHFQPRESLYNEIEKTFSLLK
jgi:UDP-glucose 4-epimerase